MAKYFCPCCGGFHEERFGAAKKAAPASGNRFEYRRLDERGWQVYGDGLRHVCCCDSEDIAKMVTEALNR